MLARGLGSRAGKRMRRWPALELLGRLAEEAVLEAKKALSALGYYSAAVSIHRPQQQALGRGAARGARGAHHGALGRNSASPARAPTTPRPRAPCARYAATGGCSPAPCSREAWIDCGAEAVRGALRMAVRPARSRQPGARGALAAAAALEVTLDTGPPFLRRGGSARRRPLADALTANLSPVRPG